MENGPFIDDKHEDLPIIQYMMIFHFATKHVYVHGITTTQKSGEKPSSFHYCTRSVHSEVSSPPF